MKTRSFGFCGSIALVASLAVALVTSAAVAAAKRCGDFVPTGSIYSCNLTPLIGAPFHECFTVTSGGGAGFEFTAPLDEGLTVNCACNATGSTNPKLVASLSAFTCDARDFANIPLGFSGKLAAGGKKIVGGNIIVASVFVWAFSCNLDPGCVP